MNRTITNTFTGLMAVASISFGISANAAEPARANYENELERCIAELRVNLDTKGASKLRHRVTRVQQQGAYYIFDVETDRMNAQGQPVAGSVESRCLAHRWESSTVVSINNSEETGTRLAQSQ